VWTVGSRPIPVCCICFSSCWNLESSVLRQKAHIVTVKIVLISLYSLSYLSLSISISVIVFNAVANYVHNMLQVSVKFSSWTPSVYATSGRPGLVSSGKTEDAGTESSTYVCIIASHGPSFALSSGASSRIISFLQHRLDKVCKSVNLTIFFMHLIPRIFFFNLYSPQRQQTDRQTLVDTQNDKMTKTEKRKI